MSQIPAHDRSAFDDITFAKRTLRELKILRHLRHENLIDIRQALVPSCPDVEMCAFARFVFLPGLKSNFEEEKLRETTAYLMPMQDIYVISELMETDLASILKSPQPLSDEHCQFFIYQANPCAQNPK